MVGPLTFDFDLFEAGVLVQPVLGGGGAGDPDAFGFTDYVASVDVAKDFLGDGHTDGRTGLFGAITQTERQRGWKESLRFPDRQEQAVDLQILPHAAAFDDRVLRSRFEFSRIFFFDVIYNPV